MSQGLTQIAYDISSFFNISVQDALLKVQSGISGELEPLRRLGYALDVATLGHVALEHGITQSVNTMTQAQKAQLRYTAIMEQSGNVMGDMSRTILTPANAMRILEQQVVQLRRALGNLLIPILMKVIPYVMAFVKALTSAISVLATFFGWELPKIDYSGVQGMGASVDALADSADDAKGKLGGAADAAKKLKNATLGFDELNVISKDEPSKAFSSTTPKPVAICMKIPWLRIHSLMSMPIASLTVLAYSIASLAYCPIATVNKLTFSTNSLPLVTQSLKAPPTLCTPSPQSPILNRL